MPTNTVTLPIRPADQPAERPTVYLDGIAYRAARAERVPDNWPVDPYAECPSYE
jgi:hypothetical protein